MRKTMLCRLLCLALLTLLCAALLPSFALADDTDAAVFLEWTNPETGYRVVVRDELGLISGEEWGQVLEEMKRVTAYGNAAFWSTDEYASDEVEQARLKRRELFKFESATILVINMNIRKVSIQSYGAMYDVITTGRANTITNNIRNYLTWQDYAEGAGIAYGQICTLMEKGRIPQPMKYLSNACIALLIALMVMLVPVIRSASTFTLPSVIRPIGAALCVTGVTAAATGERRIRIGGSSDGGSGCSSCGGSSCSSCGGSSCSSCGGGGSSSF